MTASNPLRVLYVLKRFPQLSQTFVVREIAGLEAIGVEVGIEALGGNESGIHNSEVDTIRAEVRSLPRKPRWGDRTVLAAHLRCVVRHPIRWARVATGEGKRDRRRFLQAGMVADRARREHVGVLHAHFATAAADVARMASALSGVPFTVTAHAKDIYSDEHRSKVVSRLSSAAHVVTVSTFNVDYLRSTLPDVPVSLVRNAVAVEPIGPPVAGPILCVARLVEKKGVDTLLYAMAALADRCDGLSLDVVGDGELRQSLEGLAHQLRLGERVRFVGSLSPDEVSDAYRHASMLVLPCRISADGDRDGLPTVIVEAMAHGLAVISSDVVGICEVVRHGETGLLVPPDDAGSLAVAIEKLWGDSSLRAQLGAKGRCLIATDFHPIASAERLAAIHLGVAGGNS